MTSSDDEATQPSVDPEMLAELRDWDAFWTDFEAASLDEKFQMAGNQIDDNPDFDAEWAFELMTQLGEAAAQDDQLLHYLDVLERMRQTHPDAVQGDRNLAQFQRRLVRAYLLAGEPLPDAEIAALPDAFRQSPEVVDAAIDAVMYHGAADPLIDALLEAWPAVRDDEALIAGKSEYAWNTITLAIGQALEAGSELQPETDALFERLDPIVDPDRREDLEELIRHVTGEAAVEAEQLAGGELRERIDAATRLCAEGWGRLLRDENWEWSKATLAFQVLEEFYRELFRGREGGGRYATVQGTRLRRMLDKASAAAFPPGAVSTFLETFAGRLYDDGYRQGVLIESMGPWLAFLEERDLISETLNRRLRPKLTQKIGETVEPLVNASDDEELVTNIRKAVTGLA